MEVASQSSLPIFRLRLKCYLFKLSYPDSKFDYLSWDSFPWSLQHVCFLYATLKIHWLIDWSHSHLINWLEYQSITKGQGRAIRLKNQAYGYINLNGEWTLHFARTSINFKSKGYVKPIKIWKQIQVKQGRKSAFLLPVDIQSKDLDVGGNSAFTNLKRSVES